MPIGWTRELTDPNISQNNEAPIGYQLPRIYIYIYTRVKSTICHPHMLRHTQLRCAGSTASRTGAHAPGIKFAKKLGQQLSILQPAGPEIVANHTSTQRDCRWPPWAQIAYVSTQEEACASGRLSSHWSGSTTH